MKTDKRKRPANAMQSFRGLASLFILLLAGLIRLYQLDFQSIWWDEGHSILMASAPVSQIATLPGMDVHPPGFFVLLHGWMALAGRSKFALRYFSVLFSLLTIALLIRFGRRLKGPATGLWAGLLMAFSPFYVAYAQEVRMYAPVTFFALGSFYFLWRLLFRPQNSGTKNASAGIFKSDLAKGDLAAYILFTAASLYTHYFSLFLVFFENVLWLLWFARQERGQKSIDLLPRLQWGKWLKRLQWLKWLKWLKWLRRVKWTTWAKWAKRLRQVRGAKWLRWLRWLRWRGYLGPWLGSQLAILLLFMPQLRLAMRQVTSYTNPNLNPPTLAYFLTHNWQAYTMGLTINAEQVEPYLWFLGAVLGAGLIKYWRDWSFLTILAWFLLPMGLYFVLLLRQPSYEPRYLMLITPAIFLLFALVLTIHRWLTLLGLVIIGLFGAGLHSYFTDAAYFKDDADAVATWLAAETTPNDSVLVDTPHPFHYYADQIPAPTRYLFVDIHTAADYLNTTAKGRERLYWVTWWGSDTDPRGVIPYLLQKQAGPPQGEMQFRGYRLTWYQLAEQPFSLPTDLGPIDVNFDHVLQLDGLAYSETISAGAVAWATLHFVQLAPTDIDYKLSLRLRAPAGDLVAQQDKLILNDRHFLTSAWPADDPALNQTINVYLLSLTDPSYAGPLTLEAIVYDAETLAAIAAYGVPTTNDDFVSAQIGQILVGQ